MKMSHKIIGAIAILVLCVGIWGLIDSIDREKLPEWLGGEPNFTEVHPAERFWSGYSTLKETAGIPFEPWPAQLRCEPWKSWDGFERDMTIMVSERYVARDSGDVATFVASTEEGTVIPAELPVRFEWWRGEITDGNVILRGWYTASSDSLKELAMQGSIDSDELLVSGTRGPRDCTISAIRPSGNE